MRFYVVIFCLLLVACLEEPSFSPCNTMHEASDCYIEPPQSIDENDIYFISSYDANALKISMKKNNNANSLYLVRYQSPTLDTMHADVSFGINNDNNSMYYIDSDSILVGESYKYELIFSNSDGYSEPIITEVYNHIFPAPSSMNISQESGMQVSVSWEYPFLSYFEVIPDSLFWFVLIEVENEEGVQSSQLIETAIFYADEFKITHDVEFKDAINYTIYQNRNGITSSRIESERLIIDFPSLSYFDWIPQNPNEILLTISRVLKL